MFNYDVCLPTCVKLTSYGFTNKTTHKEPLLVYNIDALRIHYHTKLVYIFADESLKTITFTHSCLVCRQSRKENK